MAEPKVPWIPDREELAWAAGFFDGEGCINVSVSNRTKVADYKALRITVSQVNRQPLDRLKKTLNMGKVRGPSKQKKGNSKPIYCFTITNFAQCQAAIAMLWPWLSEPKRAQATEKLKEMKKYFSERYADKLLYSPYRNGFTTKDKVKHVRNCTKDDAVIKSYCEENNIPLRTMHTWLKKYREGNLL